MDDANKELDTQNTISAATEKPEAGEAVAANSLFADAKNTAQTTQNPKKNTTDSEKLVSGKNPTWGEKMYGHVVYKGFGFGVNLGVSSLITYLTLHSNWKVPVFFKKADGTNRLVKEVYTDLRSWFIKSWPTQNMTALGFAPASQEAREDRGKVMAGALVLTMGGHILIPIIRLFEGYKTELIQWLDKKHYGADAMENPEIQAAHERIAQEIRPTLLSTALARVGSVAVVQLSARTIGIEKNFIRKAGDKFSIPGFNRFHGLDSGAEKAGLDVAERLPTGFVNATDRFLIRASNGNTSPHIEAKAASNQGPTSLLFKYGFSDIIYTVITAVSIKPMNNWLIRNFSFLRKEPEKAPATEKPAIRQAALYADTADSGRTESLFANTNRAPDTKTQNGRFDGKIIEASPALKMEGAAGR